MLEQAQAAGQGFFRALGGAAGKEGGPPGRRALESSDYGEAAQGAHGKLDAALEALQAYAESCTASGEAVTLVARRAGDLRADLRRIVASAFSGMSIDEDGLTLPCVAWLDVGQRSTSLGSSPIDLGPTLRRSLFDRTPAVICTSATLATSAGASPSSFHFARVRLGAPAGTHELIVPSPFDFPARAVLYLPRDLPEPKDPAYDAAATERTLDLVAYHGRRGVRAVHLEPRHEAHPRGAAGAVEGRGVLVQGEAPKHTLLERFREAGDAVLVATMSFWEGVDVPGRALRLVILDKIPFAVPTDPVVAARSAEIDRQGGSSFAEYAIPAAAITLKQGFGRLLRTQDDAGIVAILDRRIVLRGYGKRLLASLPPARRVALLEDVQAFWSHLEAGEA